MQILKNIFLLGLLLSTLMPAIAQENLIDYSFHNEYTNIVLALNRLEAKKSDVDKKAQTIYDGLGYAKAANMFKSTEDSEAADKALWSKLANAARLNAKYEEAAYWYSKVTADGPVPQELLYYAQALQASGNCTEAVKWFKLYNASPAKSKVAFIENCDEVEQFNSFDEVSLNNLEGLNTGKLDFSARPYQDGIVFTSNRGGNFFSRLIDTWTNKGFTDLFYAKKGENGYSNPTAFKGAVNGKFHDGVAAFSNDDTVMYFTRNDKSKKSKTELVNLKIYEVTNSENVKWNTANELPFNGEDFSTCHPTVSKDGNTMFFSSDRPGGFGGMDVYKVAKINGEWSTPENCGPSINSAGNEVFPFITSEGDLAFSSNGHPGMGGLDVYVARQDNPNSNNWTRIVNAGSPFNSMKDDFGFYMNDDNTNGFISTSRVGGENNDDIIEWSNDTPIDFFPILSREQVFCVVDKKTGAALSNTKVDVNQMNGTESAKTNVKTDANGQFVLTVWPNTNINFTLNRNGYDKSTERVDFENRTSAEEACLEIAMKKKDLASISGSVVNKSAKDAPISNATVTIFNSCTKKETVVKTNRNGTFTFEGPCDCEYRFVGTKTDFIKKSKTLNSKKIACNESNKIVLGLKKPAPAKVKTPLFEGKTLYTGMIIPIKNINYDYNKSDIRPDAATELDKVVSLMQKYPNLVVELESHTDARGSASYNLNLSTKRANSALEYLISKGIPRSRATSRGFGETSLLNDCQDKSSCTDDEHELNRRTQVKVIKTN